MSHKAISHPDWFFEFHTPNSGLGLKRTQSLYHQKSAFQDIEVLETPDYGRVLLLDNGVMLTEKDEHIYHEMLVHPAMALHPKPEKVLIIGGGDGGSVREVLRHPQVQKVDLVEIDKEVLEVSKKFLPKVACQLDNPRLGIHVKDGLDHVRENEGQYDVILVDSTDPIGEAVKLFEPQFYALAEKALKPLGCFACQSETPFYQQELRKNILTSLNQLYQRQAKPYLVPIPTYPSGLWSFTLALKGFSFSSPLKFHNLPKEDSLQYFSEEVFLASLVVPRCFSFMP